MDEPESEQPGMANDPRLALARDPDTAMMDGGQFIGRAPERGTIVEYTGTSGPVIRVIRARNVRISKLWIVARSLTTVAIAPLTNPFTPRLYVLMGTHDVNGWHDHGWYPLEGNGSPDLATDGTWRLNGPNGTLMRFSNWGPDPIDDIGTPFNTGIIRETPMLAVRWFRNTEEYDPNTDTDLRDELHRDYNDYTNCALHVNGAWHSTFESINFFIPRRSVAILADVYPDGNQNPYSRNANDHLLYFLVHHATGVYAPETETNFAPYYSIFSPYLEIPQGQNNFEPDEEDNPVGHPGMILNVETEELPSAGCYENNFRSIHCITGLVVVYGDSMGNAVTTSTFQDIWARRYVIRNTMALNFINAGAEQFNGSCPDFEFLQETNLPDVLDVRILNGNANNDFANDTHMTNGESVHGWWYLMRKNILISSRKYFDGREMGYLIEDTDNIALHGMDIEENTGRVMIMLGDNVRTFTATGITAGSTALGPVAYLIGSPTHSGSFSTTHGPGAVWGQGRTEMLTDTDAGGSSGSEIDMGQKGRNTDPDHPFRYRIRSFNPGMTGGAPISGDDRETLEIVHIRRLQNDQAPDIEQQLMVFDRAVHTNPYSSGQQYMLSNLVRIDAGKSTDAGDNRIELLGDRIIADGEILLTNTSTNGVTVPGSVTTSTPPDGWIRVQIVRNGLEEDAYIPFYQP